jgi:peptidoglycan/LPS O-acetylase OafA/YrhL
VSIIQASLRSASDLSVRPDAGAGVVARSARIQYLRGFAAFGVVLAHSSFTFERFGVYGVALFFAISGYLMSGLVRSDDPWRFLSHRVLRIYPTYVLMVGLALAMSRITSVPASFDLLGFSLLPAGLRTFTLGGVEWTLVFEISYYTLLFLLALAGLQRHIEAMALVWAALVLGWLALAPGVSQQSQLPIHLLLLASANFAFAGGLLVPSLIARGLLPRASALLAIPLILAYDWFGLGANRILAGFAAVCLVGWAVQAKAQRPTILTRPLLALGDWSYALYLCHATIILTVTSLWPESLRGVPPEPFAVGTALLATLILGPLDVALYRVLRRASDAARPLTRRLSLVPFVVLFVVVAAYGAVTSIRDGLQNKRINETLAQIGGTALAHAEAARAKLGELPAALPQPVQGALEAMDRLSDGRIVLRGWVLTEDSPDDISFRAFCAGRPVTLERIRRRLRQDLVESLGRPDLAKSRIGFSLVAPPPSCRPGTPIFTIAFDRDGRAAVLPGTLRF